MFLRAALSVLAFLPCLLACQTAQDQDGSATTAVGGSYRGGRISTYESFLFGAFETQMQGAKGPGFIVPFYLYKMPTANDRGWQEIDFELFGKDGRYQTQILTPGNPRTEHNVFHSLAQPAYDGMHTYRMEWTPKALRFLVDGKLVREETDPVEYRKLFSDAEPMVLFTQVWAGTSDWSGIFDPAASPAWALLNYIQVERYTPGAGANGSDFTLAWRDEFNTFDRRRWALTRASPSDGAVNSYDPGQVSTRNGTLILYFSR